MYKRTIKATFKPVGADVDFPRKAMLLIHNGGSEVECDTVYLRQVITYPGTDLAPVKVTGIDDVSWAPVNCGATRVATDIAKYKGKVRDFTEEDIEDITAQCGCYYQWGRNVPFLFGTTDKGEDNSTLPTYEEACKNEGPLANKYATAMSNGYWFTDHNNPLSPLLEQGLWPRIADPCPAGWRIPTKEESSQLADMIKTKSTFTNYIVTIDKFSIPLAGYSWAGLDLSFYRMGEDGMYWTSHYNPETTSVNSVKTLNISGINSASLKTLWIVQACPIRCVLETVP